MVNEIGYLPFAQWASAFADDQTLTAPLLDRLLHHAHIVQKWGARTRAHILTLTATCSGS